MARIDIMVDLETLGNTNETSIIQLAAVAFDIETGRTVDTIESYIDIEKSKNLNVNGSTIKWWLKTNPELFKALIEKGDISEEEAIKDFVLWIEKLKEENDVYLWGNGILFDNGILRYKCEQYGLHYPIKYTNDRDMRTIVDIVNNVYKIDIRKETTIPDFLAHNAFSDCMMQIAVVSKAWNMLKR